MLKSKIITENVLKYFFTKINCCKQKLISTKKLLLEHLSHNIWLTTFYVLSQYTPKKYVYVVISFLGRLIRFFCPKLL